MKSQRMSVIIKLILSSIFILQTILFIYLLFPVDLNWMVPTYNQYLWISNIIGLLTVAGIGFVFYRLAKVKTSTSKEERNLWGVLIFFLPIVFGLIYVWYKDEKFN